MYIMSILWCPCARSVRTVDSGFARRGFCVQDGFRVQENSSLACSALSAGMGSAASKSTPEDLPFFQKVNALKDSLGIDGTVAEVVPIIAQNLGVSSEDKPLKQIVDECHDLVFGDPSSSGGGEVSKMNVDGATSAAQVLEMLTSGEQHAECCICFDDLHERPCAAFMCKGKRTCPHFFHYDCASELLKSSGTRADRSHACPICRRTIDATCKAPKASADPEGWFKCVDVESNGKLSRADVIAILVSQFPIDHAKLEEVMPSLWERWDVDNSGYLTKDEVIGGDGAHFIS